MDPQNATQKNDINVLYDFLEQNLEQKGYDDALMNPDMTHMNENLDILKRHCNIIIDKVKVYYNAQLKTADFHIESRKRNGMVDTVEELMMHKEILLDEMKRVQEIEADARNEQGHILALLGTYSKGFKNGYSAITFTNVLGNR